MVDVELLDLSFYVGQPDHLAIAEAIERQPRDPEAYANELLERAELEPLTREDFKAGVRRLMRNGVVKRDGDELTLTPRGREALGMTFRFPRKKGAGASPGRAE